MKFYIWSFEHKAWWKSNGYGYTFNVLEAGKYSLAEAVEICKDANMHGFRHDRSISEAMVPVMGEA